MSSISYSATPTQINEERQDGLESCLLAGLLIQTEILPQKFVKTQFSNKKSLSSLMFLHVLCYST